MIKIIIITTLILSVFSLLTLAFIDLKTRLLPNKFVGAFATLGGIFHVASNFTFSSIGDVITGGIAGSTLLYVVRYVANKHYERDALGLGDVKLMGAAGLWLGLEYIFLAISLGALIGLLHGLVVYGHAKYMCKDTSIRLSTLSIPAGPGFIIGIVCVAILKFSTQPALFIF